MYSGEVRVKLGPVVSEYAGTAQFAEKDDAGYRAVIDAKGRDSRGAGNASAVITMQLRGDGLRTVVSVDTDLKISGKIAQLGGGMIAEVSQKLLGQFADCLEAKLAAPSSSELPVAEEASDVPVAEEASDVPAAREESGVPLAGAASGVPVAGAESGLPAAAATSGMPVVAEPPEPLDLMGLAAGSMLKRLVPVVLVIVAVVAVVVFLIVR